MERRIVMNKKLFVKINMILLMAIAVNLFATPTLFPVTADNVIEESTVTLKPVADAQIVSGLDNGGKDKKIQTCVSGTQEKRILIEFDLSSIPEGKRIKEARLRMNCLEVNGTVTNEIYRVTRSWVEGNGNWKYKHHKGVTWTTCDGTNNWTTPGGDYAPEVSSSLTINSTGWVEWDVTGLVRSWYDGIHANYGMEIIQKPGDSPAYAVFASRDNPNKDIHPELVVTYIDSTVYVSNVQELSYSISTANTVGGHMEIICSNGTYDLSTIGAEAFAIRAENITVRGNSPRDRDNVILTGDAMSPQAKVRHIFWVNADNFTCENMTLKNVRWHGIQVTGENDTDGIVIRNVRFMDIYEQMLKVSADANPSYSSTYSDNGLVENCLFEFSAGKVANWYTCAIDGHKCRNWTVRNCVVKNIVNPGGAMTEPAIHFWNGSTGVVIEGCTVLNSERGIYIGMGTGNLNPGCIIRNNFVETVRDVGIGIENAPDTIIDNNTCYTLNNYPNSIEYRWPATTGVQITNNKTTGAIVSRDGATASVISGNTRIDTE